MPKTTILRAFILLLLCLVAPAAMMAEEAAAAPTEAEIRAQYRRIKQPFERQMPSEYVNKAVLLDYDGTLRTTDNPYK